MRKYSQFILIVFLLLSTIILVVYRHEYIKLRRTFEVLNVFDQPIKPKDCLVLNETVEINYKYRNLFSRPAPHWTKVGDNYIYSAFWSGGSARAVGVGATGSSKNYGCHIWFEHQDSVFSRTGKFGYLATVGLNNGSYSVYEFICEVDLNGLKGVPYIFVFLNKHSGSVPVKSFIPIFTWSSEFSRRDSMALCIRPDMFGHSKSDIVEFIGFHQVVGVTDFIAYDIGIQDGILTKLKMLEGLPSFVRSFSVLAWNFPFEDSALSVKALELDCILRTSGRVRVMGIVSWDHYIVPNRKVTILSSLANFGRKKTVLLNLLVQICCLNMKDDKHSEKTWPLVLRKTRCTSVSKEGTLVVNPRLREGEQRTIRPLSNVMSWYHECNESQKAMSSYDVRPSRFLDSIISNELLKLWKSGILFGDTV